MKKIVIFFYLSCIFYFQGFSQNETEKKENLSSKYSLEINIGKLFQQQMFLDKQKGRENISLGISKDLNNKFGILFSQIYSRFKPAGSYVSNTYVLHSTINAYLTFLKTNKINFRVLLGTGFSYMLFKTAYKECSPHYTGIPLRLNFAMFYKVTNNISLSINVDAQFTWLVDYISPQLFIDSPLKNNTIFYSANLGLLYSFGKKQKKDEKNE